MHQKYLFLGNTPEYQALFVAMNCCRLISLQNPKRHKGFNLGSSWHAVRAHAAPTTLLTMTPPFGGPFCDGPDRDPKLIAPENGSWCGGLVKEITLGSGQGP